MQIQTVSQKCPSKLETEVNMISQLPGHIIDKILSHLSLLDAARTSILSSNWRYKWCKLPHLVFDNGSVLSSSKDQTTIKNKLVNIVDHVLLMHDGPIERFKLSHHDLKDYGDIDRWILFLSRGSVKELVLDIWNGPCYELHSSLYLCHNLVHLELFNFRLKPPVTFTGFKMLKCLDLQHITMDQRAFDYMISVCPLLEELTLVKLNGVTDLEIHAPKLLYLCIIGGVFETLNSKDTCYLSVVNVFFDKNSGVDYNLTYGSSENLIKFFAHLPQIQSLKVHNYFLKYLSAGKVPDKIPKPCLKLSFLSLHINFNDMDECLAALCLLRSSPNLIELEIQARKDDEKSGFKDYGVFMEDENDNCQFIHLQYVKIVAISGFKQELDFIKYMLANSPLLKIMTIKPVQIDGALESLKELMKKLILLKLISGQSEIIYLHS